jgi:arylsulfatase A-like enzyme
VANVDLAPTILEAARARAGRLVDGRSLLPLARSAGLGLARDFEIQDALDEAVEDRFTAVRERDFLYAEYANGDRELYDLRRDPFELTNPAADPAYAAVRAALAARLSRLRHCRGAACRTAPPRLPPVAGG